MKELEEVLTEIDTLRDQVYEQKAWQNGEWLSQAIVKLSVLTGFLGSYVASAEHDADTLEAHYKVTRERRKLELIKEEKTTATQAESQAYVDTEDELQTWNKAKYQHKMLSIKRTDSNNLVVACQSDLRYMIKEREQS